MRGAGTWLSLVRRCSGPGSGTERVRTWRRSWPELAAPWRGVLAMLRGERPEQSGRWPLLLATWRPERTLARAAKEQLRLDQEPARDRIAALGRDLAAAHFFCFRGCAVKVKNGDDWVRLDKQKNTISLPNKYVEGIFVEKIDCENMIKEGLRYEGLGHFDMLEGLTWISLKGNKHIDDWAVDRLVSITYKTLEYINLDGCNVTHRCVSALYKIENLKMLELSAFQMSKEFEQACTMLETAKPDMLIRLV